MTGRRRDWSGTATRIVLLTGLAFALFPAILWALSFSSIGTPSVYSLPEYYANIFEDWQHSMFDAFYDRECLGLAVAVLDLSWPTSFECGVRS